VSAGADRWIRWTTIGCVALLALIAGTVSYLHMHMLVALYGQPGWVAALTPLSVDGMILAASATLLADSRSGRRGGMPPWALLVAGSVASLAANVAVAEPALIGRVIAAWPSFALTASFELLTRQVRRGAAGAVGSAREERGPGRCLRRRACTATATRRCRSERRSRLCALTYRPSREDVGLAGGLDFAQLARAIRAIIAYLRARLRCTRTPGSVARSQPEVRTPSGHRQRPKWFQ
jgi:Protein of unknown function (DUF2637)